MAEIWKLSNKKNAEVFFITDAQKEVFERSGFIKKYFVEQATASKKGAATVTAAPKRYKL